jgi:hypothetical protein
MRLAALICSSGAFATGALGLGLGARVVHVPTRRIGFEFLQDIAAGEKVQALCYAACAQVGYCACASPGLRVGVCPTVRVLPRATCALILLARGQPHDAL